MKKVILSLIVICLYQLSYAQKEGRIGVFTGMYNSTLMNANDNDWGDYLPTFNSMVGIEGGYFITVGKKIPVGITGQVGFWGTGQNYRGLYLDSSYYEAYAKLRYMRTGLALHTGTNLLRRVALRVYGGANVGFLTSYSDRYEQFRNDGSRFIIDIEDNNVFYNQDGPKYGTIDEALYNPIDLGVFYGLAIDVKVTDHWIFTASGRFDLGLGNIENENKKKITFANANGDAEVIDYPGYTSAIKYHGPTRPEILRQATTNQMYGVFLGFSYRFFNKDDADIYFRKRY